MDGIFYFIFLILFLAFWKRFSNDYSSWYYFSFQLQRGCILAHYNFINGCICLLLIDSPNRPQMLAFRLCIILLACHQVGPLPGGTQLARSTKNASCFPWHLCKPACLPLALLSREKELRRHFAEEMSKNLRFSCFVFVRKELKKKFQLSSPRLSISLWKHERRVNSGHNILISDHQRLIPDTGTLSQSSVKLCLGL